MRTIYRFILPGLSFLFISCSTLLLDEVKVLSYDLDNPKENTVIFFEKEFTFNNDGSLSLKTHKIIKLGDNYKSLNAYLSVIDNSIDQLTEFEGRVYHLKNGNIETFNANDLSRVNLSNRNVITSLDLKYVFPEENLDEDDLIETVTVHKRNFGRLGINFSLNEISEPAYNVKCIIRINVDKKLQFKTINGTVKPVITQLKNYKVYSFAWKLYRAAERNSIFEDKNSDTRILANIQEDERSNQWIEFAQWYSEVINPKMNYSNIIRETTQKITTGKYSDKKKMEAIYRYCQDNFRYEQVYLKYGEIIPNKIDDIFTRKFADCKDYSCLMYAMAHSIGLNPKLALCYRGRGGSFYEDIAVSQFNHLVLYHEFDGKHFWYDATNRKGKPGITTFDLVNQKALIIDGNKSRVLTIAEEKDNQLLIKADYHKSNNNLAAVYKVTLTGQYAVGPIYLTIRTNEQKIKEILSGWFSNNISDTFSIQNLDWQASEDTFSMEIYGVYKKGIITVEDNIYIKINKYLDSLLKENQLKKTTAEKVFFNPDYSKISLKLAFNNLALESEPYKPFLFEYDIKLDQGPFVQEQQREEFYHQYIEHINKLSQSYKLSEI